MPSLGDIARPRGVWGAHLTACGRRWMPGGLSSKCSRTLTGTTMAVWTGARPLGPIAQKRVPIPQKRACAGLMPRRPLRRTEMHAALRSIGLELKDGDVSTLMLTMDKDGDGMVNYTEFCKGVEQYTGLRKRKVKRADQPAAKAGPQWGRMVAVPKPSPPKTPKPPITLAAKVRSPCLASSCGCHRRGESPPFSCTASSRSMLSACLCGILLACLQDGALSRCIWIRAWMLCVNPVHSNMMN